MNSIPTFHSHVIKQLENLEASLESIPASTITFVAKPDRAIDSRLIDMLPQMVGSMFSIATATFRNCTSFIFHLDKPVMCKLFRNGTLQITGCKTRQHPLIICKRIQQFFGCVYSVVSAMENIYAELGMAVDKMILYTRWRQTSTRIASPPIGSYTAVRLRIPITECAQTKYFVVNDQTFGITSLQSEPTFVNVAIFHNGKILFSGLNRSAILSASRVFVNFAKENKDIFIQRVTMFC